MSIWQKIEPYLVDKPQPIIGAKTIQIILLREILDYIVLRTEDTRELNTAATPLSIKDTTNTRRVAFLGTKQKAVESRFMEQMLRTSREAAELGSYNCYLKDNLCLACPRCGLFGATNTESGGEKIGNIKHRIEYSTAFSLMPFDDIETATTFNALNDATQTTGQALGTRYAVAPASLFPSIVTLKSVTKKELILTIKTLLGAKSYGAESRIGGDVRNTIMGFAAGWEEILTPLELTLELYDQKESISSEIITGILNQYKNLAGNPDRVVVFNPEETQGLIKACADVPLDKVFIESAFEDIENYRKSQAGK